MCRTIAACVPIWVALGMACHAIPPDVTKVCRQLDEITEKGAASNGVTPIPRCGDTEFLRRIWLDLAGRTPHLTEVTKIASGTKLNREDVVLRLLKSPEFGRNWGRMWTEYLTDRRQFETEGYNGRRLLQFLSESFRDNRPYHELVRELILGEGTSDVSGSVNFLLRYNAEPVPLAGAVSQKFLGTSMQCAECHDHPHARWKQKDFWGLAAHFARLRKMTPTNPEEGESFFVVIERPRGELMFEDKRAQANEEGERPKKTVYPQLPGLSRSDASKQRRTVLVDWLTEPTNPYLSRHLVNTVWERLLGAKLIPNLDQWPPQTTSPNIELLNLLAEDFTTHEWNFQRLIQIIVLSETYQRSSHDEAPTNSKDSAKRELELANWARSAIRPLSADQLHLSIAQAFGYHHDENDHRLAEATDEEFTQDIPVNNLGPTSMTLGRSLSLYNSEYIRGAIEAGTEAAVRLYGAAAGSEHINRVFMSLLSRKPTNEELEYFQDLGGESEPREGLQDIVWVLINSTEFVTNH